MSNRIDLVFVAMLAMGIILINSNGVESCTEPARFRQLGSQFGSTFESREGSSEEAQETITAYFAAYNTVYPNANTPSANTKFASSTDFTNLPMECVVPFMKGFEEGRPDSDEK